MSTKMRVIAISSNTGAFGHTRHIFCEPSGILYAVERIRSSYPNQWNPGDWVDVPTTQEKDGQQPQFNRLGAEYTTRVGHATGKMLEDYLSPDFLEKQAAKAAAIQKILDDDVATPEELEVIKYLGHDGHPHGTEPDRPAALALPLKSRASIVNFLTKEGTPWRRRVFGYGDRDSFLFCFDVKAHNTDLDFNHLLKICDDLPGDKDDVAYIASCRERYNELFGKENYELWNQARDDATREIIEDHYVRKGVWEQRTTEAYSAVWPHGKKDHFDVELGFYGCSGGWLVIEKFQGVSLRRGVDLLDPYEHGQEWDEDAYIWLRKLYDYVVNLHNNVKDDAPDKAIEYHAAWMFFNNYCSDIPRTEDMIDENI